MNAKEPYPLNGLKETFQRLPQILKLGIKTVRIERGSCLMKIHYSPEFVGNSDTGLIHGGIITTLLDTAAGAAAFSVVPEGSSVATLDLRLDYLTQAEPGESIMGFAESYHQMDTYARGCVVKQGKSITNVRIEAWQRDPARPVAAAHAHFLMR